jgi:hypothetical protein
MLENRNSEHFPQGPWSIGTSSSGIAQQPILQPVSLESIYRLAAERAARDHELDRLFNPEYYGDHGSGI